MGALSDTQYADLRVAPRRFSRQIDTGGLPSRRQFEEAMKARGVASRPDMTASNQFNPSAVVLNPSGVRMFDAEFNPEYYGKPGLRL